MGLNEDAAGHAPFHKAIEPDHNRAADLADGTDRFRLYLRLLFPVKSHPLLCADDLVAATAMAKLGEVTILMPGEKSAVQQLLSEAGINAFTPLVKLDRKQDE